MHHLQRAAAARCWMWSAGCPLAQRAHVTSLALCKRYSSWSVVHSYWFIYESLCSQWTRCRQWLQLLLTMERCSQFRKEASVYCQLDLTWLVSSLLSLLGIQSVSFSVRCKISFAASAVHLARSRCNHSTTCAAAAAALLQVTWYSVRMRGACTDVSSLYAWRCQAGWMYRRGPTRCRDGSFDDKYWTMRLISECRPWCLKC